ncbi:MAG: PD40 domain-containing protein [Planctomycetes bacterium]|nr:PD40 domain-containing protein [Planctomycetota bacterium]
MRDLVAGTTQLVSVDSSGAQANGASGHFGDTISSDGRFVAFRSAATNLVTGDTNAALDVFVRDRVNSTTERVSVSTSGMQGNGISQEPAISADGRYVAFQSLATNLVAGDTNAVEDVFLRDRQLNQTVRVSLGPGGAQSNGASREPSISANGNCVSFSSLASNLVASDLNGVDDIFLRDHPNATTELVSVSTGGAQGNSASFDPSAISSDGRYVAFYSVAWNLVTSDTNGVAEVFLRDRLFGTTERLSVATSGTQGNAASHAPSISADGHVIAFESLATNLVVGDANAVMDVFARERVQTFPPLDVCQPGVAGVMACPCLNPPGSAPRGCDNSAATGGARLSATDGASLALDQLVFSTSGENPTATSILLQGNTLLPAGSAFGQGVRCVGGSLRRLYVRNAVGGAISVPNVPAGDLSVSARSAALGDTLVSGTERWYAVYYRDPIVLGLCPATSTFNVTQMLDVIWSP